MENNAEFVCSWITRNAFPLLRREEAIFLEERADKQKEPGTGQTFSDTLSPTYAERMPTKKYNKMYKSEYVKVHRLRYRFLYISWNRMLTLTRK